MPNKFLRWLGRHVFLSIGFATFALVFGVPLLGHGSDAAEPLQPIIRIAILPMYICWMPFTMLNVALFGPRLSPTTEVLARVIALIGVVVGFAPYVLLDRAVARLVRALRRRPSAPA
jgi:hypothetical protein